jgi:CRP/FNR family transcriptional regulator
MNIIALLDHTDLFGPLSEKSKQLIAAIVREKTVRKDQVVFMEGEKGAAVYILASGAVRLTKSNAGGDKNVVIKNIKPGEIFAEVILFEQDCFPATAIATRDSSLFVFPRKPFIGLLDSQDFRDEFIRILLRKQRYLTERLRSIATMDVNDKFFHYLKEHYGPSERIVPGVSKKALAEAIDATPETLSRLLLKLKNNGVLDWSGKEIVIKKGFWETWK